jgi:ABC-type Fe3+ transport system permease subunit
MLSATIIAVIFYFVLLLLVKNTYVSPTKKSSWNYKDSDYTEKLKLPLWLWFISIVLFLIPMINLISSVISLILYFISLDIYREYKIKLTGKFFKFLNKKF